MKVRNIAIIMFLLLSVFIISGCAAQCPDCICQECKATECPVCECVTNCDTCPVRVEKETEKVVEEKLIYRYVCPNQDVVSNVIDCYPADEVDTSVSELITSSSIDPACIYGYNGGEAVIKAKSTINETIFEIREKDKGNFSVIKTIKGSYFESTKTFVIDEEKFSKADFMIESGKKYEMRIKFYFPAFKRYEYSRVYNVDTTTEGTFMTKKCS